MWMRHIDKILVKELGFRSTTHDRCIFRNPDRFGSEVYLLKQVDDILVSAIDEKTAKDIFNLLATKLQTSYERENGIIPVKYLGPATDFNGTQINQAESY